MLRRVLCIVSTWNGRGAQWWVRGHGGARNDYPFWYTEPKNAECGAGYTYCDVKNLYIRAWLFDGWRFVQTRKRKLLAMRISGWTIPDYENCGRATNFSSSKVPEIVGFSRHTPSSAPRLFPLKAVHNYDEGQEQLWYGSRKLTTLGLIIINLSPSVAPSVQ